MSEIQDVVWESVSSAELGEFTDQQRREKQTGRELERQALEYKWKDLGDIYLSFCGRTREYRDWMSRARGCRKWPQQSTWLASLSEQEQQKWVIRKASWHL